MFGGETVGRSYWQSGEERKGREPLWGADKSVKLATAAETATDLDFVVLQGNKRKRETGVAAEPEHKWYVVDTVECSIVKNATWVVVLANHFVVTSPLLGSLCKFVPYLK